MAVSQGCGGVVVVVVGVVGAQLLRRPAPVQRDILSGAGVCHTRRERGKRSSKPSRGSRAHFVPPIAIQAVVDIVRGAVVLVVRVVEVDSGAVVVLVCEQPCSGCARNTGAGT